MYTKGKRKSKQFESRIGQWSEFQTPWGKHRGIVEAVKDDWVLFKMPKEDAPSWATLVSENGAMDNGVKATLVGFGSGFGRGFGGGFGHDIDRFCRRDCFRDDCFKRDCFPCWFSGPWCFIFIPIVIVIFFSFFCW